MGIKNVTGENYIYFDLLLFREDIYEAQIKLGKHGVLRISFMPSLHLFYTMVV